jgi:hypothetical protein
LKAKLLYTLAPVALLSTIYLTRWSQHRQKEEARDFDLDAIRVRAELAQFGHPCFKGTECPGLCAVLHREDDDSTISEILDRPQGDHICTWTCVSDADCKQRGICKKAGLCEPPNRRREQTLVPLQKACDAGRDPEGMGCYAVAESYWWGDRGVATDPTRAVTYYERACQHGADAACEALKDAFHEGDKVPKDERRSATYQKKLCALDPDDSDCPPRHCRSVADCWPGASCPSTGMCQANPVPNDPRVHDHCRRDGVAEACLAISRQFQAAGNTEAALDYLRDACAANDSASCESVSAVFAQGSVGGPTDAQRARWYHAKACAIGLPNGACPNP